MAKKTDCPHAVRQFIGTLNKFSGRFYDYTVFHDFIDYAIACLLFDGCEETRNRLTQSYKEDYKLFSELFKDLVLIYDANITDEKSWFDPLGEIYMAIASSNKKSGMGQFFTPQHVCEMMAKMMLPDNQKSGLKINDPACGSGRTLLAANSYLNECFVFGEDLDPLCAKMSAINLAIHGCQGQVCCMNSLSQDFYFGFEVNPFHRQNGFPPIPHIVKISESQSFAKLKEKAENNDNNLEKPIQLTFF